jgi:hypothetical protein
MTIGSTIASLSPGETKLAGQISGKTTGLTRSWEYWSMRVANKAGGLAAGFDTGKSKRAKANHARTKVKPKRVTKKRRR